MYCGSKTDLYDLYYYCISTVFCFVLSLSHQTQLFLGLRCSRPRGKLLAVFSRTDVRGRKTRAEKRVHHQNMCTHNIDTRQHMISPMILYKHSNIKIYEREGVYRIIVIVIEIQLIFFLYE